MNIRLAVSLLVILLISACSSGGSPGDADSIEELFNDTVTGSVSSSPVGSIRFFGHIDTRLVGAWFSEVHDELDARELAVAYSAVPDTCIRRSDSLPSDNERPFESEEQNHISAGEVIVLSSDNNTYGELFRSDNNVYLPQAPFTDPVPTPLVVDIPGDDFPSFPSISIPAISRLRGFEIMEGEFGRHPLDAEMRWQVDSGVDDVLVWIELDLLKAEGEFNRSLLVCVARDDGSFVIPEAIRQQIMTEAAMDSQPAQFTISFFPPERAVAVVRQLGDSLLVITGQDGF